MGKKRIVFVEAWANTAIHVRIANEYAKQHPEYEIYYITDKDSITKEAREEFSSKVRVIGLQNRYWLRKVVYFPLYLASLVSKRAELKYSDVLYLPFYKDLTKTLDEIKPDLIEANVILFPITMQAGRYARKNNIPFVLRTQTMRAQNVVELALLKTMFFLNRKTIRHASLVLPWTPQSDVFIRKHYGADKKKIYLLPAGTDTSFLKPKTQYSKKGPIKIITIQRMVPYKDYPTLIRAFDIAVKKGKDLQLTLVGAGPVESVIREMVTKRGLQDRVKIINRVPYRQIPALTREHDVLVLTSYYEAIGMVVPEAMGCGLPVIVSDTAGAISYVDDTTGFVFKTGSAEDLAHKLMLLTPARIEKLGRAGPKRIAKHFTVEAIVKKFGDLVKKHCF